VVHVFADACPDPRWVPVDPDLEDVYFHTLGGGTAGGPPGAASADAPSLQRA
jgi:hypothetical protein